MNETIEIVKVGLAEIKSVKPPQIIRTSGLGSCVGVVVYSDKAQMAAMAHVMLPDSSLARENDFRRGKYANTAVETLYEMFLSAGMHHSLKAKIAGGSQMFQFQSKNDLMRIGKRNVLAVKELLQAYRIKLMAEDVGGSSGRTIEFDPKTSVLSIRKVNAETFEI